MTEHPIAPIARTPEHQFNRLLQERDGAGRILPISHPTLTILAHDENRHLSLSVKMPEGATAPALPSTVGIRVEVQSPGAGEAPFLTFTSMAPAMDLVFLSFARFVIDRSTRAETSAEAIHEVSAAHAAFREYMEAEKELSREKTRGLLAELLVLRSLIESGTPPMEALMSWRGPFGENKDFILPTNQAIEVKSAPFNATSVRISSLEQLDPNNLDLFLATVRLEHAAEDTEKARALSEHIGELRAIISRAGGDVQVLESGLNAYGLSALDAAALDMYFVSKPPVFFSVSEDFPRITPDDVPHGVSSATYAIDFIAIRDYEREWHL